jgi:nucleoside-diphosphate-sugar epimerase
MSDPSLLIVGCGDLGQRVGHLLGRQGWRITALRRHPPGSPADFDWRAADYSIPGSLSFAEALGPDFVLATFTPAGFGIEGYRRGFADAATNLLDGLGKHRVSRLIMVSSTRVYAEAAGGWVEESSELSSTDPRALAIIDAERRFLASLQPASVVRFGGIYGDPDGRLLARIARGELSPARPVRYTNRIHRDDAAGFLAHLLGLARANRPLADIYNGVDDDPAPAHDVESWLAAAMGVPDGERRDSSQRPSTGHKRCRNARLHASGYRLRYRDYRAGYRQVLNLTD